jgi:nucleoside-diphosphate-sugar epimerase
MKILVVGGTGLLGGDAAMLLKSEGHDVVIAARKPAQPTSPQASLPLITGDYLAGTFTKEQLQGFDALLFAAGSDIRHVESGETEDAHWQRANAVATPAFFALAKEAGVKRAVLLNSFYPLAAPHLVGKVPYVTGRRDADVGVRALASADFNVCSVNPPYVIGTMPGFFSSAFAGYVSYALGKLPLPRFAPAGGANFISTTSLSRALATALVKGENNKAYLIGDEDLAFKDYLELFFKAVGDDRPLEVLDQEHPFFPDGMLYAGRGGTIYFEPDADEQAFLGYKRNDVRRAVKEIVEYYRPIVEAR